MPLWRAPLSLGAWSATRSHAGALANRLGKEVAMRERMAP